MPSQSIDIPITDLRLDPENPRFVTSQDTENLSEFLTWFVRDADLFSLATSISANGYFAGEPLLVAKPQTDGSPHTVVEGNRRFAAVLLLRDPELLPRRRRGELEELSTSADLEGLERLPCVVYDDRDEILTYLGNRHIVGVRPWDPLAKARYLKQLRERAERRGEPADDRTLARAIGSRSDYVRRLLRTLDAFDVLEDENLIDESESRFSVLGTALSYSNISDYVDVDLRATQPSEPDTEKLKEVATWIYGDGDEAPKVRESRQLKDLNDVVGNEQARENLKDGATLKEAQRDTRVAAEALTVSLEDATSALEAAVRNAQALPEDATDADRTRLARLEELVQRLDQILG